jgi:site-specific recombinase XerD
MQQHSTQSLSHFTDWLKSLSLSQETVRAYSSRLAGFLRFCRQNNAADEDWPEHINAYLRHCLDDGMKTSTVGSISTALDTYCLYALGSIPERITESRPEAPETAEMVDTLFAHLRKQGCSKRILIFSLMIYERITCNECVAINLGDVYFADGQASIVVPSRRKAGARKVCLSAESRSALLDWLQKRKDVAPESEQALLVNGSGHRITSGGLDFLIRSLGHKAYLNISARKLNRLIHAQIFSPTPANATTIVSDNWSTESLRHSGSNSLVW